MYIENDKCLVWRTVLVFIHYFVPDALYKFNSLFFAISRAMNVMSRTVSRSVRALFLTVSCSRNGGRVFEHDVMSCAT